MVRCIRGSLYDVILDLRKDSPTFGKSFGAELSAENRRMMYVPKGFGHGFITLADDTEAFYFVDEFYSPAHERGVRWNDPKFRHRMADRAGRPVRQGRRPARLRPRLAPHGLTRNDDEVRSDHPTMKILFTGASSFTGFGLVRELSAAGHQVTAVLRSKPEGYPDEVRRQRARRLLECCTPAFGPSFGDDAFLGLLRDGGFDVLCPPRGRRHQLQEPRLRRRGRRRQQRAEPPGRPRRAQAGGGPPRRPHRHGLRGGAKGPARRACPTSPPTASPSG
ncbi:dTDP-4-dehydrorhamnose 3,5-epimerase (plasmid) [Planctomyces sp. SH-PL62]|nr:dTDP-4-dehydrorhamnose 3,5-epimerase [Planctomyces sp. SH-PL62]